MSKRIDSVDDLAGLLARQQAAFREAGAVDADTRRRRMQTAIDLLVKYH